MDKTLEHFLVENQQPKNIYITIPQTFEKQCKGCSELLEGEKAGMWIRVKCKADKCIK